MPPSLPSAFEALGPLRARLVGRALVLVLDYDGTLTPIVAHPGLAALPGALRDLIERLSRRCVVAVISGRDLEDVRARVGLDGVFYAGSHGFEFAGPDGWREQYEGAEAFLASLDAAQRELRERVERFPGVWVERKRFAIAVHVRQGRPEDEPAVEEIVDGVLAQHGTLRKGAGKKVFELRPHTDWDKGRAVRWLLHTLHLDGAAVTVYLGDDATDEDAFRALDGDGLGVLVAEEPGATAATHVLRDPDEVARFLELLTRLLD